MAVVLIAVGLAFIVGAKRFAEFIAERPTTTQFALDAWGGRPGFLFGVRALLTVIGVAWVGIGVSDLL